MRILIAVILLLGLVLYWKNRPVYKIDDVLVKNKLYPFEVTYIQGPRVVKGKPILLSVWASKNEPSLEVLPDIDEIYSKYRSRGLQVLGLTFEDEKVMRDFLAERSIDYAVARDPENRYAEPLRFRRYPHVYLLDHDGDIRWEGHPFTLAPNDIEEVLTYYESTRAPKTQNAK